MDLSSIEPGALSEIARQSLGLAAFELIDWTGSPLRHEKVIETTGGLFRFSGRGTAGSRLQPWSAVLKVIQQPDEQPTAPAALSYWRRELLAYQSGLLADLPPPIRTPQCYGLWEKAPGGWIWMEDVREAVAPAWTLMHFQEAACQLGQFAGAYLLDRPIPGYPWLCGSFFRSLYADDDWWSSFIDPAAPDNAWQRPVVQAVYPAPQQARVLKIWEQKERWLATNERLPQVFCHHDAHRRNMLMRSFESGQIELVLIDWAFCGCGAVANDLGELIGTSLSYFAVEPAQAGELEAAVLAGYLAGLRQAGWDGDERLVRLGYLISLALYWGGTLPCEAALAQPGQGRVNVEAKYGRPLDAVLPGWALLAEFSLDRADEALFWMRHIPL